MVRAIAIWFGTSFVVALGWCFMWWTRKRGES